MLRQTIAVGNRTTSPFMTVYPWSNGFWQKIADPSTLLPDSAAGIKWSPDGNYIGIAHATSPFISVYPWTGQFGAKFADPSTLPTGGSNAIAWHPNGNYVAVAGITSPNINVYSWSSCRIWC